MKPRRALLVIDVQNEYFTGNLPIEYPPTEISLPNITRAIDAARAADIPVIIIQHTAPAGAPIFDKGSPGWELHAEIAKRPYAALFEKTSASSFAGTGLGEWLTAHKIDTLTIVGYMTHNCDATTTFDAAGSGYSVEVLSDATGSLPYENRAGAASAEEIHRVFTVVMHSNFAAVLETSAWIESVETGRAPERGNLLVSNQTARNKRGAA
ncbi:cysteine hydrolase family protein [Pendulispora albinea]|uniref:Cysteine hydrolase n=1 Tax=Pendulispora albinea TaxID=2741071 RepID=A0ABZ2M4I3_9BACT